MIGYKVVRRIPGDVLISSVVNSNVVIYDIRLWSIPDYKCGDLVCFDTLKNAKQFRESRKLRNEHIDYRIFRCKYIPSLQKRIYNENYSPPNSNLPQGTVFAKAIKLLKEE